LKEQERQRLIREAEEKKMQERMREEEERRRREEESRKRAEWDQQKFLREEQERQRLFWEAEEKRKLRLVLKFNQQNNIVEVSVKTTYDDLITLVKKTFSAQLNFHCKIGLYLLPPNIELNPEDIAKLKDLDILEVHN